MRYLFLLIIIQWHCPYSSFATTINVPITKKIFYTNTQNKVKNRQIEFEIDKRAKIYVDLKHISEINIDYISGGFFRVSHLTAYRNKIKPDAHLLMGKSIEKGKGRLTFNYRQNFNWSIAGTPVIYIEGTGNFSIINMSVETIADEGQAIKESNSALFWRPEIIRLSTINFLTPIYWDYNKKIHWTSSLGMLYFASLLILYLYSKIYNVDIKRYVPYISILFLFIFSSQFIIRFIPAVNWKLYVPSNEKIRRYYLRPEFGQLTASAREITGEAETIAIAVENGDWFSPEAFCFNMLPIKCLFYQKDKDTLSGLGENVVAKRSDIDLIAYYNFDGGIPENFKKIFSLNKNVFIARKK